MSNFRKNLELFLQEEDKNDGFFNHENTNSRNLDPIKCDTDYQGSFGTGSINDNNDYEEPEFSYSRQSEFPEINNNQNNFFPNTQQPNDNPYIRPQAYQSITPSPKTINPKMLSCIPKTAVPEMYRQIFNFSHFNRMQSESFETLFEQTNNCVISSPTGSGKTVLFELAIIQLLIAKSKNPSTYRNCKILYMASTKALCKERYDDWLSKFGPLSCSVGLLTGDTSASETDRVKRSDVIICTPEKWDALTRRWFDYSKLLELVKLLLIDEIHTLGDTRGTSLEVVTTRMKAMKKDLRIVALSATLPNIYDISGWLTPKEGPETSTLVFGDEYRAVKLRRTVYGYKTSGASNDFQFDSFLNTKIAHVLDLHAKMKPVLIFCPTRSSSINTAKKLTDSMSSIFGNFNNGDSYKKVSKELYNLICQGIAYHHAGLSLNERLLVEQGFKRGDIKVLCSTSTLAVGVNLPAYLVVIKGTKTWISTGLTEYSELDILQMMGRAGRPQFEDEGACVIMTDNKRKDKYENLVKGTQKLESSLYLNLHETFTAEIALKTITSLESAYEWLCSTFFYQRFLRNPTSYPAIYGMTKFCKDSREKLTKLAELIMDDLIKEQMVIYEGVHYVCTGFGSAMSNHYVMFETMKIMLSTDSHLSLSDVLKVCSKSKEFQDIRLKHSEKRLYREINNSPLIMYPKKEGKIETNEEKILLIIQSELGGAEYPTYNGALKLHSSFLSDKMTVFKNLHRILRAGIEVYLQKKDSISLVSIMEFFRCVTGKCWETNAMALRQLEGVGIMAVRKFTNHNIQTLQQAMDLPRPKIENILGLKPGGGARVFNSLKKLPILDSDVSLIAHQKGVVDLSVKIRIHVHLKNYDKIGFIWNGLTTYLNLTTELSNSGTLIDFRRIPLKKLDGSKNISLNIKLQNRADLIQVHYNFDNIAGLGFSTTLDLSYLWSGISTKPESPKPLSLGDTVDFDDVSDTFSDEDIDFDEIFEKASLKKKNAFANTSSTTISEKDSSTCSITQNTTVDNTFTRSHEKMKDGMYQCNHKCKDKTKCRHICCKEGIPKKRVLKGCNHSCKDKSKCRHLCCKETLKLELEATSKTIKPKSQKTLKELLNHPNVSNRTIVKQPILTADSTLEESSVKSINQPLQPTPEKKHKIASKKRKILSSFAHTEVGNSKKTKASSYMKHLQTSDSSGNSFPSRKPSTYNIFHGSTKDTINSKQETKQKKVFLDMLDSDYESDDDIGFESILDTALTKRSRVKIVNKNDGYETKHETKTKMRDKKLFVDSSADCIGPSNIEQQSNAEINEDPNFNISSSISSYFATNNSLATTSVITNSSKPKTKVSTANSGIQLSDSQIQSISFSSTDSSVQILRKESRDGLPAGTPATSTEFDNTKDGNTSLDNEEDDIGDMLEFLGSDVELE